MFLIIQTNPSTKIRNLKNMALCHRWFKMQGHVSPYQLMPSLPWHPRGVTASCPGPPPIHFYRTTPLQLKPQRLPSALSRTYKCPHHWAPSCFCDFTQIFLVTIQVSWFCLPSQDTALPFCLEATAYNGAPSAREHLAQETLHNLREKLKEEQFRSSLFLKSEKTLTSMFHFFNKN